MFEVVELVIHINLTLNRIALHKINGLIGTK